MSENKHVAFDAELCGRNPEAAADRIAELEAKLFPYADATEISGISWDGKYLIGNKESIKFFHEMKNRGEQIDVYKRAYDQNLAAKDDTIRRNQVLFESKDETIRQLTEEVSRLRKSLSDVLGYDRNFYDNGRPGYEKIARDALNASELEG